MARKRGGLVGTLLGAVEDRTGVRLESASRVDSLEEAATGNARDARLLRRELHNLAYTALDAAPQGHDVAPEERKAWATLARETWMTDPQAGAAVDLLNDFTFGRGVPRPRAKDPKVQEILDEAWDDTDNQLVLTTFNAQIALGTDLQLQSNLFLLLFDDGDDGKVKLGLLNHDTVDDAVRDPENRMRVAYFKATRQETGWDWNTDKPLVTVENGEKRVVYYEHWRNAQTAKDEEEIAEAVDSPRKKLGKPPHDKLGTGRVYHIAVNRTSEQVFGVPTMQRTIRWFTAYNDFMSARVDTAKAAAAFIMKRKVKGTKGQVERMAETALAKTSLLGAASPTMADGVTMRGPAPASVLTENDMVSHEPYTVPTGAGDATSDGQMIRSQISAATHFPQHYLGDAGSANLATATSMELPVLKHVEGRQEVFEQMFRWFLDRAIERAKETERLTDELTDEEFAEKLEREGKKPGEEEQPAAVGEEVPEEAGPEQFALAAGSAGDEADLRDEVDKQRERDFTYEFGLPSPLRRMMGDLVTAVMNIAKTFDPNGTNMELNKILLGVVLGEGLELDDPAAAVDAVFPPGYEDPAVKAFQQQQNQQPAPGEPPGESPDGAGFYGAPTGGQPPEDTGVMEGRFEDLPGELRSSADQRVRSVLTSFDDDVLGVALSVAMNGNGNGNGKH